MTLTIRRRMIQHIPVLELVPTEKIDDALPLVIYYHGWQTKKELALTAGKKIAQQEMRVVIPDSMYHGERKVEIPSTIPSFRFWSTIQYNLSEFSLIKTFYQKRELIHHNLLGVAGFSMGGMTTAGILTQDPDVTAAAILMGSPDFGHFISKVTDHVKQKGLYHPILLKELLSWTHYFDLNLMPEKIAGRPLYFWHGTDDAKLPYDATHQFYLNNKDTDYGRNMIFETGTDEPHILTIDIMNQTAGFFKQYLQH